MKIGTWQLFIFLVFVLAQSLAHAGPASVAYEGFISDAVGVPINPLPGGGSTVIQMKFEILNPSSCSLYVETHNVQPLDGVFSVKIGTGTVVSGTFASAFAPNGGPYGGACNYFPAPGDTRKLRVHVFDAGAFQTVATMDLSSSPFAMNADFSFNSDRLQGFQSSDFIQTTADVTQARASSLFAPSVYNNLVNLDSNATGAFELPSGNTAQRPSGTLGQIRFNSQTGDVEFYNGAAWTSMSAPPIGTSAGTVAAGNDPRIVGAIQDLGSTPGIQAGAEGSQPAASNTGKIYLATNTRRIYRDTGSWVIMGTGDYNDLINKPTGDSLLPSQTSNNGKFLTTNGTTASWGSIAWSQITSVPTTLSGFGITDAVSSTTVRTANTVFAGPTTGGSAAPTFRALVANDIPTLDAAKITTGTLGVVNGGTGQSTYTDGQLLIGNSTGNTLTKATLTAGSNISITNGAGSITISTSGAPPTGTASGDLGGTYPSPTINNDAITSGKIADGTIANVDIAGAAGISHSKLANASAGQILMGNAGGTITATTISGDASLSSAGALSVEKIRGSDVSATAPANGNFLRFNGSQYQPTLLHNSDLRSDDNLSSLFPTSCTNFQTMTWNGVSGNFTCTTIPGDNMGSHMANQNINMNGFWLSGNGSAQGIFVDSSNKVGIGTSTPIAISSAATKLDVSGSIVLSPNSVETGLYWNDPFTAGTQTITNVSGLRINGGFHINAGESNSTPGILFEISGNEKMRVKGDGNVGIGTSTPSSKLHVYNGDINLETNYAVKIGDEMVLSRQSDKVIVGSNLVTPLTFWSGAEKMRLDEDGDLGIGTTDPLSPLDVRKNGTAANPAIAIGQANTSNAGTGLFAPAGNTLAIATGGIERMAVDNAGAKFSVPVIVANGTRSVRLEGPTAGPASTQYQFRLPSNNPSNPGEVLAHMGGGDTAWKDANNYSSSVLSYSANFTFDDTTNALNTNNKGVIFIDITTGSPAITVSCINKNFQNPNPGDFVFLIFNRNANAIGASFTITHNNSGSGCAGNSGNNKPIFTPTTSNINFGSNKRGSVQLMYVGSGWLVVNSN